MHSHQKIILADTQIFVRDIFFKKINDHFAFHNIDHTIDVVNAVNTIATHYQLTNENEFSLKLAAWFHDTGFSTSVVENHEMESMVVAKKFLKNKIDKIILEHVLACIRSTRLPQKPSSLIENIICDADLYHLGTDHFLEFSHHLKKETEQYFNISISEEEWRIKDIKFLQSHTYFTNYCRLYLEPVKQQWLQKLQAF